MPKAIRDFGISFCCVIIGYGCLRGPTFARENGNTSHAPRPYQLHRADETIATCVTLSATLTSGTQSNIFRSMVQATGYLSLGGEGEGTVTSTLKPL